MPTGLAALIFASVPLWLAALRLTRERLPWQMLAGVGLGFVGVAVLARPSGGADGWGIALVLLGGHDVGDGFLPLVAPADARGPVRRDVARDARGRTRDAAVLAPHLHGFSPSAASLAGWAYLVTFGSLLGFSAYVWLLANAPLGLVSTYAFVNPVVAITLGVLFRGEELTWRLLVGATIVIVAVATVVRQEPAVPRGEPEPVAVD